MAMTNIFVLFFLSTFKEFGAFWKFQKEIDILYEGFLFFYLSLSNELIEITNLYVL